MNDYARAPNQPLLTTSSPTFAGLTINGAATFAATVTATGQFLAGNGSEGSPAYAFTSLPTYGMYAGAAGGGNAVIFTCGGAAQFAVGQNSGVGTQQVGPLGFTTAISSSPADLQLARLAAASLRQGLAPSATPVAQTFTIGEASRPGTDTNVGGANGTIRSGLGTGTGTRSSLFFQTPTLAGSGSGAQTYGTRFTISTTGASFDVDVGSGTGTWGISNGSGIYNAAAFGGYGIGTGANDVFLMRLAAASFRQGNVPSATPIAQTFTLGEASRPGTDSDVGGASGTIRSGLGTGTGTPSTVKIQGAVVAASGSTVQTYGTFIEGSGTTLGFYGVTPIARAVLATGAGATVDDVITALQNLGLVKQS